MFYVIEVAGKDRATVKCFVKFLRENADKRKKKYSEFCSRGRLKRNCKELKIPTKNLELKN